VGPRNHASDGDPDWTNPFAAARGDVAFRQITLDAC